MKKYLLSTIFILSYFISFSQLVSYEAIWVKEDMNASYLEVEEFWSKVKEQAIADGSQDFWVVFQLEKDLANESEMKKPDFIVMNGFKDSIQRSKSVNWKELARSVYKKELSKKKFEKKWSLGWEVRKETRSFLVERLDNTEWKAQPDQELKFLFNGFQQLNEDYENYEMKYFKNMHMKRMDNGQLAWWEFNKVLSRSDNANKEVTHFTMDVIINDASDWNPNTDSFVDQMMIKNGVASRKRIIGDTMKVLYAKFPEN